MGLEFLQQLKANRGIPKEKKKYVLPKKSAKKLAQEKVEKEQRSEGQQTELQKWYERIMQSEMPICWETGEKIDTGDKLGWHGSIAHILPKDLFDSVKTHPMNYMILKMWGGTHGQYDSSWEKAAKMSIWPYAVRIINILYPLLTREEKSKLPETIIQEIKPEIYNKKNG